LIHPAVWPQQTLAENCGGLCPFSGKGAGSPSNTMLPVVAYLLWLRPGGQYGATPTLPTKWHLDPSSRLATLDMGCILVGCWAPFGEMVSI